ncbi:MAG: TIGR02594 family protein [Methylobacterium sp.]|nr:TIGR02594 family protein [Methylobacterium sp.]MCA4923316.1 TIGR02594 family protein [Methylobacterium sp.]
MLPAQYRWLETEPGPRMIIEALKQYGTLEASGEADNPKIIGWQDELDAAGLGSAYAGVYRHDPIPWCGLFLGVVAHRANIARRPERNPPKLYLAALEWASFGVSVPKGAAALGDVLVFKRPNRDASRFGPEDARSREHPASRGGGHVGLYVGQDSPNKNSASAFHVLGSNQQNRVSITRLSRNRLVAVRRPAYRAQPANVRPIALAASGSLSVNEA